ncbi:MAG: arsenical resistance protein ArsH [Comamonas sp.]|nr:arsenical resistance protein ArsH [Comamonas sp.]
MSCVTIYHNPNCGTSRNTLAMIRQSGVEPNIVEYLQNPPSRAELKALLQGMGKTVREVLRQKGTPYEALDLDNPQWTDEQLLDFVEQHPILLNRPIVVTPLGVRLCRPSEAVLDILPNAQIGPFTKEDGELVEARQAASAAQLGTDFPALATESFQTIDPNQLKTPLRSSHAPRILMLYGSLRERSYSKLLTLEAAKLLEAMGAEVRIFNHEGLPQPDAAPTEHPKVKELRDLVRWCEGMVWTSPERHGAMTGIMKSQIDWIPLSEGAIRPTQGKTLAVMQVCGGSQSFNAVNQLRVLGRWMRLLTIPNQSSVAKAYEEFEENGRMKPSSFYDRVVDVMEELMKFTLLTRDIAPYLVDRYSERKEDMAKKHAQTLTRL